ncbi:hypothetical protein CHGG_06569 [Chaetomium globosum CBS 148.51]|uniref:RRM domain-containing protein n=1 Tax=Chaetomium globosum (strain ATCC 6205 / CBS 148.51 / DSM 1962 / NBRC 6347 / NRRL 1970) TaxID=306901 RepID=Q2H446_CHAGB|nr:uncharacterized protein CHGG_06569 [Chaetomium globosum CBS 148.51]EAQ89950.1 hypothetical protein CHGG_06569 [Chaetomium globosum CBS 148.51]
MSGMLRANRVGGSAGKLRRVRSFSLSDASSSGSSDSDDAGARLSAASLDDSPPRVRFSSVTEEIGHMSITSSTASAASDRDTRSSPFQVGNTPGGDIFESPPAKAPLKPVRAFATPVMPSNKDEMVKVPEIDSEERRLTGSAATSNTMSLTPSQRPLRTFSSRQEIGGIDAQGIYPPSACVFVANLPESKDDRALEAAVTREFSQFGTVFVKIRREVKGGVAGMPYAFAQYTNDNDAKVAIDEGRGIMILGRPCRTEMVKANRTFVIYSRRGDEVTIDTAREILEPYGELSKCELLSTQMCEAMSLPTSVLVEFAKFDPKRDLNTAVRQHDGYCIDAFDVKKKNFISRSDADEEFLRKYDVDRRSIFVGNLAPDTQKEEIMDLFSPVGEVLDVNVIRKPNYHGRIQPFAFVEFARADIPDQAVQNFHDTFFRGNLIKVERKFSKHAGTPRRVKSQAFSIRSTTTPKTPRTAAAGRSPMASGNRFSGRDQTSAPPAQQGYNHPAAGPPFVPFGYPAPSPRAPADGQPLLGASGLPVTPSATPFGPNPFTYMGGYWPNVAFGQDATTGHTYWGYSPVDANNSPAAPAQTPTRGGPRESHHFHGGN